MSSQVELFQKITELASTYPQTLGIVPAVLCIVAAIVPRLGDALFLRIEGFGSRLAKKKRAAILSVAVAAVVVRLSFLPFIPVPVPETHDEFSYLLAADTFAHGRLTNSPHPMWIYFDTFHVNPLPTYMSKYPPAQGAVLALGELLGHPWIGVLLSVMVMCGAIVWALEGWLPPGWALLGGILALCRFAVSSYWVNSYWGGAVAATGGALVIGALPRILRSRRPRDAILLAVGISILANSRPFEGLIFCLPVAGLLLIRFFGLDGHQRRRSLRRVAFPVISVLALAAAFTAYDNWRVTGSSLRFPYSINNQMYLSTPNLVWQKLGPPRHYLNPQFDNYYNDGFARRAWREARADSLPHALRILAYDGKVFVHFFLWPELCLPLIALPWILLDRRTRFLPVQMAICFAGFLVITWHLLPHYAAPLTATTFALVIQGMRHLRLWSFRGHPVGIGLSRAIVVSAILLSPFYVYWVRPHPSVDERTRIAAKLDRLPGKHVVIVRYLPQRPLEGEWVYNAADIDGAKIVWAREIPGISIAPLLHYYPDRKVWLVEPGPPDAIFRAYTSDP